MGKPRGQKLLTDFEEHFCEQYILDFKGARAARAAGSTAERPEQAAYELLRKPDIRKRIDNLNAARRQRLHLTQDRAVLALSEIAYGNITDVASWDSDRVTLAPSSSLEPSVSRAIKSVKHVRKVGSTSENSIEVVMHDKLKALELLAKMTGVMPRDDDDKPKAATVNLVMPNIPDPDLVLEAAQDGA